MDKIKELVDFYMWMQEKGHDHNVRSRVERKAEMYLSIVDVGEKPTIPIWRFCAYKSSKDYESGKHYFMKYFLDHAEMKVFSAEFSAREKPLYPGYCSTYLKLNTDAA